MLTSQRSALPLAVAVIGCLLISTHSHAAATIAEYTGTTVNLKPGAGEHVSIQVLQWSSDDDRARVVSALADFGKPDVDMATATKALDELPTVGYVWTSGAIGYSLKYAHRLEVAGGERVIVVTNRPIGSWAYPPWKPVASSAAPAGPYTVVELRLSRTGTGNGKMSLSTPAAIDTEAKAVALENYDAAPVLLEDVADTPKEEASRP